MKKLLLVHGAMHGAWCWNPLIKELQVRGIDAIAVDLPGNGADRTAPAEVTLARYAEHLLATAQMLQDRPVILGHSAGGLAVSAAIELAPSAFSKAIYVAALLPADGDTLSTIFAKSTSGELSTPMIYAEDGASFWMTAEHASDYFYNDCDATDVAWALQKLTAQPLGPLMEPIHLTAGNFGSIEKTYIKCTKDFAVPPALQDVMIATCQGIQVHELPCGHSPFLALPSKLADLLEIELRTAPSW